MLPASESGCVRGSPGSAGVPPAWTIVSLRLTAGGTPALPGDETAFPPVHRQFKPTPRRTLPRHRSESIVEWTHFRTTPQAARAATA